MARPADIRNDELRGMVETAFVAMRAGKGADAVRACADAYLRHVQLHPEVLKQTIPMRGREISRLMRWPGLGANMKPGLGCAPARRKSSSCASGFRCPRP